MKNKMLRPMVIMNRTFSMPRLAANTPPVSEPVNPPNPTPLFCNITLVIKAIEVIINAMSK